MRLTTQEQRAIIESFRTHFTEGDQLWLFGSRVDDQKRGGDIDLYIETTLPTDMLFKVECAFRDMLEMAIGEQKIDVVINNHSGDLLIYHVAKETGIILSMNKRESIIVLLQDEATIHATRLKRVLERLSPLHPFKGSTLENLSLEELGFFELLTGRFAKLQDILGARIFPALLELLDAAKSEDTPIDRLNRLEKFGYIENANQWKEMRALRNQITHEYPNDPERTAKNLNILWEKAHFLVQYWEVLDAKITALLATLAPQK